MKRRELQAAGEPRSAGLNNVRAEDFTLIVGAALAVKTRARVQQRQLRRRAVVLN
jgi:hypothetical protein